MKSKVFAYMLALVALVSCGTGGDRSALSADEQWTLTVPAGVKADTVSIDTMSVENPFITYDSESNTYYMVADGGYMWTSKELRLWHGPYNILLQDRASWMSKASAIYSPEIHKYNGRYYYMASFERADTMVAGSNGELFPRRSCVALVSNSITGPYRTIDVAGELLDIREKAVHPTFCTDEYGVGYMIYNHDASQNGDGTVQIVRFSENMARRVGEAYIMFSASRNGWSRSANSEKNGFSPVMEAPFLFVTDGGRMGIIFTTCIGDERALGVAYTETGHLDGPWVIEPEPFMTGNVGSAMMFKDYDGTLVMAVQKDTVIDGKQRHLPRLYKMESQFEKLQIKGYYKF